MRWDSGSVLAAPECYKGSRTQAHARPLKDQK
jgi:hypothetical protein